MSRSLAQYFDLVCDQHRFNFVMQDGLIHKYCKSHQRKNVFSLTPLMVFIGRDFNVYWEYRDGVMDAAPSESCIILYQILEEFGNKPFVYVKPNFSKEKCRNIVKLAEENNGKVITCASWSYMSFYSVYYNLRHEIRQHAQQVNKAKDVAFLGSFQIYPRTIADYTGAHIKYGVYPSQLQFLKNPPEDVDLDRITNVINDLYEFDNYVSYPSRQQLLEKLQKQYPVSVYQNKSAHECLNIRLGTKLMFQPHGVGPTHAIYECMMLGVPSIIPECSYLDQGTRKFNMICSEFMDAVPCDEINELLSDSQKYHENSVNMIDLYENTMTHHAIVNDVFSKIEEHCPI